MGFRTRNYPSKLSELVRMTSDAVYISLQSFANITNSKVNGTNLVTTNLQHREKKGTGNTVVHGPLILRFPAHQRPDNGQWNNIVLMWNSLNGEYSLVSVVIV